MLCPSTEAQKRVTGRLERLLAVAGDSLVTAESLADRLHVTPRTIYRDIGRLRALGVRVNGQRGIGYMIRRA
jgi:predicted DNA-binding transcriptional regulator YafY